MRELLVESFIDSEVFTGSWRNINYCNRCAHNPNYWDVSPSQKKPYETPRRHINLRIPRTPARCPWDSWRDRQGSAGHFQLFTAEKLTEEGTFAGTPAGSEASCDVSYVQARKRHINTIVLVWLPLGQTEFSPYLHGNPTCPWGRLGSNGRRSSCVESFSLRACFGPYTISKYRAYMCLSCSPSPGPQENKFFDVDVQHVGCGCPWPKGLLKSLCQQFWYDYLMATGA